MSFASHAHAFGRSGMSVAPYRIRVPTSALRDLRTRLATTRWPTPVPAAGWRAGTDPAWLQELAAYWRDGFDWAVQEEAMNRWQHMRADIDGLGVHFIHEQGLGPEPLPLLLLHGWPDSFLRMAKIIALLTDPAAHGGDPADAFDVVVPSLPGFGFSDPPREQPMDAAAIADVLATLMSRELGYKHFAAHGGDLGAGIAEMLARRHARSMVGIHITEVPYWHLFGLPADTLTQPERDYLEAGKRWQLQEGAYALLQSTRPQTLAYGLNDSPVGLAAWIAEKFRAWSDCDGDIERCFSKDELLTNITLYWVTQTIASSFLPYYAAQPQAHRNGDARPDVPAAVAIFPKDLVNAPREFAERVLDLQRYTVMPRGGHFAALEQPDLLVEDIRAFYRPLRAGARGGRWPQAISALGLGARRSPPHP
jgi:pimeloyl-ACP methyl ester carboxylesterase